MSKVPISSQKERLAAAATKGVKVTAWGSVAVAKMLSGIVGNSTL